MERHEASRFSRVLTRDSISWTIAVEEEFEFAVASLGASTFSLFLNLVLLADLGLAGSESTSIRS